MCAKPELKFLSLFVPDLAEATERYQVVLGVRPTEDDGTAPSPHPFAAAGPVLFDLVTVKLALYQADPKRGTHPGDVGVGVQVAGSPRSLAERAGASGGRVFYGPEAMPGDGREMAVFVLPDRHFIEVVGSRSDT
jgi:catechol 2,3-dioxygenase-like lactoylglutathione lyase family enzyme